MSKHLIVDRLRVSFGRGDKVSEVLRDVRLEIAKGEFVAVIGHSGCGKSTLLNVVAGLIPATGGGVLLNGREVNQPGPDRAVVFQNHSLLPWLTTYENVRLGVDKVFARSKSRAERHEWTMRNLALVHMEPARDKRPHEISGGMKQRVGIARALAMQPEVLLLDEPFGALDALTRAHLQESLMEIHAGLGTTVLMITHDVDEAVLLSDRIVMMTNGPAATIGEILTVPLPRPRHRLALAQDRDYLHCRCRGAALPLCQPPARGGGVMAERLVVVGGGMVAARLLRELLAEAPGRFAITVIGAERWAPYDRIQLSAVLAGERDPGSLGLVDQDQLARHGVKLRLGTTVAAIDREARHAHARRRHRGRLRPAGAGDGLAADPPAAARRRPAGRGDLPRPRRRRAADGGHRPRRGDRRRAARAGGRERAGAARARGDGRPPDAVADGAPARPRGGAAPAAHSWSGAASASCCRPTARRSSATAGSRGCAWRTGSCCRPISWSWPSASGPRRRWRGRRASPAAGASRSTTASRPRTRHIWAVGECAEHRGIAYGLVAPLYEQAAVLARRLAGDAAAAYAGSTRGDQPQDQRHRALLGGELRRRCAGRADPVPRPGPWRLSQAAAGRRPAGRCRAAGQCRGRCLVCGADPRRRRRSSRSATG